MLVHRMVGVLVALSLTSLPAAGTRADAPRADAPLLVRLARSPVDRHRDATSERTRTLERLIRALPDVAEVTASLTVDDPAGVPLDRPLAAPRVGLVLRTRGRGPDDAQLRALAQSVVRALAPGDVTVVRQPVIEAATPELAKVGPFEVGATSATLLRTVLALSLAGNAVLAALLLWRARPNRPRGPFVDRRGRRGPRA